MKKFYTVLLLTFLLSLASANAFLNLDVPSSVDLGTSARNKSIITTFLINNTGNETMTNIIPVFSSISEGFNLALNASDFNLAVNESATMQLNATILPNSPTGNTTIGNVYFKFNGENVSSSFPVKVLVSGGLNIEDLDVTLVRRDSSYETQTDVENGEKLDFGDEEKDEVRPGTSLEFDFRIENLFLDDDLDIDGVSVKVTIFDIDDGEDIDEESDDLNLNPEEIETANVKLDIPLKVEEGTYDVEILVTGEDTENVEHTVKWNLEVGVEKDSHDVLISSAYLTKSKISCYGTTTLKANILNLGGKDEDVKLEAKNSDLGFDYLNDDITLVEDPYDDDNEYSLSRTITVEEGTKPGTYPIEVNVYIFGNVLFAQKEAILTVECEGEEPEEEPEETIEVKDFETCVAAGYGIKQEDPRKCVTPEGKSFSEKLASTPAESEEDKTAEDVSIPVLEQDKTVTKEKEPMPAGKIVLISVVITVLLAAVLSLSIFFLYKP